MPKLERLTQAARAGKLNDGSAGGKGAGNCGGKTKEEAKASTTRNSGYDASNAKGGKSKSEGKGKGGGKTQVLTAMLSAARAMAPNLVVTRPLHANLLAQLIGMEPWAIWSKSKMKSQE